MTIKYCEKCGGYTPEEFALCPSCMREAGAEENEVKAATEILDIVNIINLGDTDASQRAAIESILKIKNRLEGISLEEKEKAQAPPTQETVSTSARPAPRGQSSTTEH